MTQIQDSPPGAEATLDDLAHVERAYARILGRAVDPAALIAALQQLNSTAAHAPTAAIQRMAREDLDMTLRLSDEAASRMGTPPTGTPAVTLSELLHVDRERFVQQAYRQLFGRAVDGPGLRHWCARLERGLGRLALLVHLQRSAEGRRHAARLLTLGTFTQLLLRQPAATLADLCAPLRTRASRQPSSTSGHGPAARGKGQP